ncbi:unnamed protein product [Rhizophagus irregularis]|nr:unnamed protein product [Rhizophagus irregularis]
MDEKPKDLWEDTDDSKYQMHVTISTIDSTIKPENVDESVVYIEDLEKRKQAYGICEECKEPDLSSFQFSSDTNYTAQSTSTNPISECLDVQLSELELNEICQDSEHNIE